MTLHPKDMRNAYTVGALSMIMKMAVIDLEYGHADAALKRLKAGLANYEEDARRAYPDEVPLPAA